MDIMMPCMDGWNTITEIMKRGFTKDVVISIFTARGTLDHEKIRGLELCIHDYITKPFDVKKLILDVKEMAAM